MNVTFVIIDDNEEIREHSLLFTLEDKYKNVNFYSNPNEGLQFIKDNLDVNLIVLLDIEFSEKDKKNGHILLEEIYNTSALIPVILWSGINETTEEFSDFINNHAFGFLSKTSTLDESMLIVDKAYNHLKNSLDNTIEDWIIQNEVDKDKTIYLNADGDSFSLNDILKEIRLQTPIGKEFSSKLNALTIDLLLRKKEKL
ncbi:response regulator [Algibacter amylolyticus]|uniref:Response regulator n=1 Tax=Algibacter amylolyticus TaxID=1608400 RepID=A0A5M7AVM1_9FLAO|nr:response regulator [Algibacter amylolyticus]KAA5821379.1 response regulator [Algibacter amylolyticus]MBB5268247.1 DNA-binding NtrC family response regulator [Algibacter amylolyticus]TSJ72891.1 response regulator [Algibacter amylolyticus]